jgi:hypothetical protein
MTLLIANVNPYYVGTVTDRLVSLAGGRLKWSSNLDRCPTKQTDHLDRQRLESRRSSSDDRWYVRRALSRAVSR